MVLGTIHRAPGCNGAQSNLNWECDTYTLCKQTDLASPGIQQNATQYTLDKARKGMGSVYSGVFNTPLH